MAKSDSAWLRQYYAAWDSGDLEAITSWFDDDVVLEDVPTGHAARGAEEARTFVSGALKMAPAASSRRRTSSRRALLGVDRFTDRDDCRHPRRDAVP